MKFIADLHVHSKYSRATSRSLDLENLYVSAQLKGITVVGTGDCVHPLWFREITEKTIPAEPGLFRLRREIEQRMDLRVPKLCRSPVRFLLQTEISNIYKKEGKTRKNHNLVFLPDLTSTEKLIHQLDKIGNIHSDGRPILGLDAKNLLEIVLEISEHAHLVPAHIWTPWFSVLGSKSGFNSILSCFEDLSEYIFAAETGLSSDPEMNRRLSLLDNITMISNSDAHSPMKLGREANLFQTDLSYDSIFDALQRKDPDAFQGTIEFFPEEGKYHLDGHRNCGVCLEPTKTKQRNGICPVCEKKLTLGVMHRVEELSDREIHEIPDVGLPCYHLIPLEEILSEIFNVGVQAKAVQMRYARLLEKLGPEIPMLYAMDLSEIASHSVPLLAEAIKRMRAQKIQRIPGYDGEYGKIRVFHETEKQKLAGQKMIFPKPPPPDPPRSNPGHTRAAKKKTPKPQKIISPENRPISPKMETTRFLLNPDQKKVVEYAAGHMMVVAGPGTGKTRTITERILQLIHSQKAAADEIGAITFTTKAADEMKARIYHRLPDPQKKPKIGTFHAFCLHYLSLEKRIEILSEEQRDFFIRQAIQMSGVEENIRPKRISEKIQLAKQQFDYPEFHQTCRPDDGKDEQLQKIFMAYQKILKTQNIYDFEDLIFQFVMALENHTSLGRAVKQKYKYLFVDEYQDINFGQYRMICALLDGETRTPKICIIGDPDQSIYGFRGSDRRFFQQFIQAYPSTETVRLHRNYRSTRQILQGAYRMLEAGDGKQNTPPVVAGRAGEFSIGLLRAGSEIGEARCIAEIIHNEIGGTGYHDIDAGDMRIEQESKSYSYADFVVLYRTSAQSRILQKVFKEKGIPFQVVSRTSLMMHTRIQQIFCCLRMVAGSWTFHDLQIFSKIMKPSVSHATIDRLFQWSLQKKFQAGDTAVHIKAFPIPGVKRDQQSRLIALLEKAEEMKKNYQGWLISDLIAAMADGEEGKKSKTGKPDPAVEQLQRLSTKYHKNLRWFLEEATLMQDTDTYLQNAEQVSLMTLHASKGLEFPFVFVVGCEDGRLPFRRKNQHDSDLKEERRLFFVGMTRAKERLILSNSRKRRKSGNEHRQTTPSPFLFDIGSQFLVEIERDRKKRKPRHRQLGLF